MVTNVVTWRGMGERKTDNSLIISGFIWCCQESNRGHKDFQSFARFGIGKNRFVHLFDATNGAIAPYRSLELLIFIVRVCSAILVYT